MPLLVSIWLLIGALTVALAQNPASEAYALCLRGKAALFDDYRSDPRSIAGALLALCISERLVAMQKAPPYLTLEQAQQMLPSVREHDLDVATIAVLRGRSEREKTAPPK